MQILSWNLNGLKACIKRNDFEQLRKLPPLDVLCFQETRTQEKPIVFKDYHHYWYPAEEKKYSGTLTLSLVKPQSVIYGLGVPELDKEGRVITIDLGNVFVVNTYVPNSQGGPDREEYRMKWDVAYHNFLYKLSSEKPVIACGDYNVTMSRIDVYEENMRIDWAEQGYISDERFNLQSLLDNGFTDAYRFLYPDEKNAFTWWSNRRYKRNENRGWRLDYFIVSDILQPQIRDVIHHQDITGSDHCPIVLDCAVEDNEYVKKYQSALETKQNNENEEKRLAQMWNNRQRQFDKYEKKLATLQAEITIYTGLKDNNEVLKRQIRIMDDIRFKCLAVQKVAKASAPPGVDDVKWKTNADKMRAALDLEWRNYKASPKRIIEIKSKNTGKIRRTGILTYRDKAMSILCGFTFSPVEEAYADRSSFAFRPGRSRQDAIIAASYLFNGNDAPVHYVYADIRGFYAALQHKWIMQHVPIVKDVLHAFLKAGHIFDGELFPSGDAGISEGSPLSPDIANFTLDGLQKAIYNGLHGRYSDIDYANGAMVRYADDVLVAVRSSDDAKIVVATIRKFLEPRGLVLSEEKSKIGIIWDGLEMIGFHMKKEAYDMVIRPKHDAVERFKCGIHDYIINCNSSQRAMIKTINKKLMGWAGQYRCCDAYDSYREIDAAVKESLLESAIKKHPKLQTKKLIDRYWYSDSNGDMWYALPKEKSVRVIRLIDTLLVAPKRSRTDLNPYLSTEYFDGKKKSDDIDRINSKYRPVWDKFDGKCMYCGRPILPEQKKELVTIDHTKKDALWNKAYVHSICVQDDYQFYMTMEDVDGITDYDVYEMLERISASGMIIRDSEIPEDWRFIKLYEYFGECSKPKITLSFKEIEQILGFELSEARKNNRSSWYSRKGMHMMADAWNLQGYKLKRLYIGKQKALFEAQFEDAEQVVIPPEILDRKIPANAKHEIEHFLQSIVKKYCLGNDDIFPRNHKGKGAEGDA